MNKSKISRKFNISFKDYLRVQLKNPRIKGYYDEYGKQLEIAYGIIKLRKEKGITQLELANKIGTNQSNIARMESGRENFTTEILFRIAKALDKDLKIQFIE